MQSKPGGDNGAAAESWEQVLAHRPADDGSREAAVQRFTEQGVSPAEVKAVLVDCGDALYAAAAEGAAGWAEAFGGPLSVALLAAEVSMFAAHVNSRASGIRSVAVTELLEEFSAVTVAGGLGVARQKVYEIARAGLRPPYIKQVPWRTS